MNAPIAILVLTLVRLVIPFCLMLLIGALVERYYKIQIR